jgi:hypothetical protein
VFETGADLVMARVSARPTCGQPPVRECVQLVLGHALAGQLVSDSQCGYRLYGRGVLDHTPMTPGRYEVETEIAVRAARLGFRLAEVEIPTVYGEEKSQIRAFRDVPRIAGTLLGCRSKARCRRRDARGARGVPLGVRQRDGARVIILVTNDDGIFAPALKMLKQALDPLGPRRHRGARPRPERHVAFA